MDKYLLGVDVGTSSIKVAIINENGKLLGISNSSYQLIHEKAGYAQIDTESMWSAYIKCLRLLFQGKEVEAKNVVGIGISSLCPGLAAMGADGEILVDPIIYCDSRSVEEAEIMKAAMPEEERFGVTANNVMAGAISGTSMLWIKRNMPNVYDKTKYFGHVNTLMAQRMTGEFAIDYSNASYTGLFETVKGIHGTWSPKLCEAMGIAIEKLPPLMTSSNKVGEVIHPDLLELGIIKGTTVVIGGGDTACATLAAGVVKAGDVCESVGTTNVLTTCVDQPKFDKSFINRCHVVDGTWIYQGALSHTGASYQWFRDNFYSEVMEKAKDSSEAFGFMNKEAEQSPPGSGGVVFLPYMQGERSPIWDSYARGVFFGMTLETTRKDFNRAIMEGCGYGLRQLSEIAEQITGIHITKFASIGGGAKSEIWAQIKADITGKDIEILDMNDMAPVGAALLAGVGSGIYPDVVSASEKVEKKVFKVIKSSNENQKVYDRGYQIYTNLYPQIKELYRI